MPDTEEIVLDEFRKRIRTRKFLGKHKCSSHLNGTIEKYLNLNTGDFEWYYIIEGFYNAEQVHRCPFCGMKFERSGEKRWRT